MQRIRLSAVVSWIALGLAPIPAWPAHLDIEVKGQGDQLQIGFCQTAGTGCDLPGALAKLGLPKGTLPADGATGQPIFAADFGDFPKPYDTANPGFQAPGGALQPGELIRYRALGALEYWNPAQKTWAPAPADVRIRLFGGLDAKTVIVLDYSKCEGLLVCIPEEKKEIVYEEGSTIFASAGISGAASLLVDNATSSGGLHTHLDWFLENASGTKGGPDGAYLVQLQLQSDRRVSPSQPFWIAFTSGLAEDDFVAALTARMTPPAPTPNPDPAAPVEPPAGTPSTPSDPGTPPPPDAGVTAPDIDDRPLLGFRYRERASEKLVGCRTGCREAVSGSAEVTATMTLVGNEKEEIAGSAMRLILHLGVTAFEVALDNLEPLLVGGANRRLADLPVLDDEAKRVGSLGLKYKGGQLQFRFSIGRPVFAASYLDERFSRSNRAETISLKLTDAEGKTVLSTVTVAEIAGQPKFKKTIRRGTEYSLGRVQLRSRAISR